MNCSDIAKNSTVFPSSQFTEKESFNENGTPIIKVVGVGGGGDNAVNHMYKQGIPGVSFVVTNTDRQALNNSPVPERLLLGPTVTRGLGAGNKPERAKAAAEESAAEIAELFDEDTKMVFITAGMGGGTGTGASPVVARIARERGMLTVGIVTIPFLFEGEKKIMKALEGADEMSRYVDAMLVINNERLTEIYSDLNFENAFDMADETLTDAARSISEAIQDALNSPLLKYRDIQTSKRFLFNLYYSQDADKQLTMGEMNEITNFMTNFAKDVDVIWGTSVDNSLDGKVKITILASGFDISLGKEFHYKSKDGGRHGKKQEPESQISSARIAEEYGQEKVAEITRIKASANYILLSPEQMDNDVLINFVEKNPTYRRGADVKLREEWKALCEMQAESAQQQPAASSSGLHGRVVEFD